MGDTQTTIEGRAVEKEFGGTKALQGVTFSVAPGEIVGFLGPNGAGKTTLIRLVTCTSFATGGELCVFGLEPGRDDRGIKARIGLVPQENNLDPDFTVYQNLLVFSRYFGIADGEARRRIDGLLAFARLADRAGSKVDTLSGGMKRRLIIARSLLNNPDLLILDEPTTGLDPQARRHIWDIVRELNGKGTTVILTTHYMEEAAALCSRIYIMDQGSVIAEGPPAGLIAEHIGVETVEIESCDGSVLEAIPGRKVYFKDRTFVYGNDRAAILTALAGVCAGAAFTVRPSNLEDLFIYLTGRELKE